MLALIASLFLAGAAHTHATQPLVPRSYTGEECGVTYPTTQRLECGVQEYNSCPDVNCPGYLPAERFETRTDGLCRNPRTCAAERRNKATLACS
ncbi:MAG: hypothetical protein NTX25_14150, partial [Proteobacteria bacterium]|nr:hypothetical protein [Pseudomonadota bacterium]